jgi:hypothetical protein
LPRSRKKKAVIGFCGAPILREDIRERGIVEFEWGGVSVEIPGNAITSLSPAYRYACVEWAVEMGDEALLYPVKRAGGPIDREVDELLKRYCIVSAGGEGWMCTKGFFDTLYEKLRKEFSPP